MPKQKTHKGSSKRFKITSKGKIKRRRAGGGHLMSGKNPTRRKRVKGSSIMTGKRAKTVQMQIS